MTVGIVLIAGVNKRTGWLLAGATVLGALYLGWTAFAAMRSGSISVKHTFLGFDWWSDITADEQPLQFWIAVILHWMGSVGCLVGLVVLLRYANS
jgi:hypothetical protein